MKTCNKCGEAKPLDQFHKRAATPDGRQYRCKACAAARERDKAQTHDHYLRYKITETGRAARAAANKRYRARHKGKAHAHQQVDRAIARGALHPASTHNCTDCARRAEHYHHDDYSRPLDVTPLCRPCHRTRHSEYLCS